MWPSVQCQASTVTAAPSGEEICIFYYSRRRRRRWLLWFLMSVDLDLWPLNRKLAFHLLVPPFWFFYAFFVFELQARTGQTRRITRLIGQLHNKSVDKDLCLCCLEDGEIHLSRPRLTTESVYYIPLNLRNYTNYAKYYSKILLCQTINVHSVQLVLTST